MGVLLAGLGAILLPSIPVLVFFSLFNNGFPVASVLNIGKFSL